MTTYTIGETAERSGFSPSALRYYEGIGLVEPPTRSGAGYRLYDDGSLARLAFIARAKQLGCTLEEITDLVDIREGERCDPVQRRLHDLVTDKLAAAERRIAELTALAEQLRHAAARLGGPSADGPCRAGCACMAPEPVTTVACTIGAHEVADRVALLERLGTALVHEERTDHGVVLRFDPSVEADVRRFTVDEQRCCRFWGFDVERSDDAVVLRWDAPPGSEAILDAMLQVLTRGS